MLLRIVLLPLLLIALIASAPLNASEAEKLKIIQITPSGEGVPAGNQILITFNKSVVPLGRMERSNNKVPITISPELDCQWRWLTPSSLACQLDQNKALILATEYILTVKSDALNDKGDSIATPFQHTFKTLLPKVNHSNFDSITEPGKPTTRLYFNQVVTKSSASETLKYQYLKGGKTKTVRAELLEYQVYSGTVDQANEVVEQNAHSQHWKVRPKNTLPKNTAVKLIITAGLATPHGKLPSIESETIIEFHTFNDFRFVGLSCSDSSYQRIQYSLQELDRAKCNPEGGVNLDFSTPLDPHQLHGLLQLWENDTPGDKLAEIWANDQSSPRIYGYHRNDQVYPVALPTSLTPNSPYQVKTLAQELIQHTPKDLLGQALGNTILAPFRTRHYTPSFQIPQHDVVLESQVNSDVSLAITNIDSLEFNYVLVGQPNASNQQKTFTLEPGFDKDLSAIIPVGVRALLNNQSGMIVGHVSSPSVKQRHKQRLVAQITPYQVHAKIGHFSSIVWVTDLATGELIKGAKVEVLQTQNAQINKETKIVDTAITDITGVARLKGLSEIDPTNVVSPWCSHSSVCNRLIVKVSNGENSAILPIVRDYQVGHNGRSEHQIYNQKQQKYGHVRAWGTTAQGLYRQGDTIQYKLYVRDQDLYGLTAAPKGRYTLSLEDASGKEIHTVEEVELNDHGALNGEIILADNAAMGWYQFILRSDFSTQELYPLQVLVTDFTPSPFRLKQHTNGDLFSAGQQLVVNAAASLHSGGPFTDAQAAIEVRATPSLFTSDNPVTKEFNFSDHTNFINHHRQSKVLMDHKMPLDAAGKAEASITLPVLEQHFLSAELSIVTSVQDDRGKAVFSSASARYLGVDRLVGLKSKKWVYESHKDATLEYIVVNNMGQPVAGSNVTIAISKRETQTNKKQNPRGTHPSQFEENWVDITRCEGSSQRSAQRCSFIPESAGVYRFTASIKDTQGRPHTASQQIWVTGEGYVNWQQPNSNELVMVPESDNFSVGDKARYLLKNPFPGAQAIVTIERYGILDSWQQTLEGSTPVIEFDIKPEYLPGVYLSVLVTKPRTAHDIPERGQADRNKPDFKLGYQKLNVSDPEKAIKLAIESDATTYKPGEVVTLTIKPQFSKPLIDSDIELAVSVLDEAVFDLVKGGSDYFDPYKGLNQLAPLDVSNHNLLTRLVGLQKFSSKKAKTNKKDLELNRRDSGVAFYADSIRMSSAKVMSPMAAGASLDEVIVAAEKRESQESPNSPDIKTRDNLLDNALWKNSVTVNDDGTVTIEFEIPDNLTAWRVLAIATTPTDKMGLGEHSFKVNQATEIRPVMPNQVMETDTFNAGFSVHNRSDQARTLNVEIEAQGNTDKTEVFRQTIHLDAHSRQTVFTPTSASRLGEGVHEGKISYLVKAYDQTDGDALRHVLPIQKRRNLNSAAVYGSTAGELVEQAIRFPSDIATDLGGLTVKMSPTIIHSVDGAFEYMRSYPYACWEQKLTKAVMASHYKTLKPYLSETLQWPNSDELPQTTLNKAAAHQAKNGGMAYFIPDDDYVSPYLSAYTALAFSWLDSAGYIVPTAVQENLHEYLVRLLRNDEFPKHFSKGMKATVRAVALSALAKNGDLSKSDLLSYLNQSQHMSLFGKAQLFSALTYFDNTDAEQKYVLEQILASSNSSAGKIGFDDPRQGIYARILSSPMRTNCTILASMSHSPDLLPDQELPSKLAQTIVSNRKGRRHWENTQDNVFCMNALSVYAKTYESQKPRLSAQVTLGTDVVGDAQFGDYKDPSKSVMVPMSSDLLGKDKSLTIEHSGIGRVYYQTLLQYSDNNDQIERTNSGIDLRRELSVFRNDKWRLLSAQDSVTRGELLRTDLFISVPTDRNFVAVRDPVAGGLEPVNEDLATSGLPLKAEQLNAVTPGSYQHSRTNWQRFSYSPWGFYHKELGHNAVVFYSDYLAKGQYHLSYFSQAIATGEFTRQSAHAEEMYNPDVFGKSAVGKLFVTESDNVK